MRLAVPIGYNFLTLTKVKQSAFYEVMGPVSYVAFMGADFNKWVFPICLFLMVILTAFNIYGINHGLINRTYFELYWSEAVPI